ncbi:anhydrase 2 [Seminavis robusta]|uniref:Carbonic anhydrase n=1 Tax=Seminavis robusta TaxID=568900 RepID=A0A9N8EEF0_9STRA|nr:anhydrase 2 [Seminavis robusta]|eukprot:Sro1031_g233470.1 anhydrase 2 (285) ;mRNA; r:28503-29622
MPEYNDGSEYAMKNRDINNILEQNKKFVEAIGQEFFDGLGSKHEPKYMWIGCADARVPSNELCGEKPGSIFVVRNVANMVVSTDVNLLSALQFAVTTLGVKHIIVCGHYDCGGIRAAMNKANVGAPLSLWLRNIKDVYRTHKEELNGIEDPEKRHRRFVELNVIEQCVNLFKTEVIQKTRIDTFLDPECNFPAPRIHALVYDPMTGYLQNLNVDFSEYLGDLKDIYELYNPPDYIKEAELLLDAKSSTEEEDAPSLEGIDKSSSPADGLDAVWEFLGIKKTDGS